MGGPIRKALSAPGSDVVPAYKNQISVETKKTKGMELSLTFEKCSVSQKRR